jgi:hypothetical protein
MISSRPIIVILSALRLIPFGEYLKDILFGRYFYNKDMLLLSAIAHAFLAS